MSLQPNASNRPGPMPPPSFTQRFMSWLVTHTHVNTQASWISRYGTAVIALLAATLLRLSLDPILEHRVPYGIYVIATTIVAWRSGLGPALVTLFIGVPLASFFFESPRGAFRIDWQASGAAIIITIVLGVVISVLTESLRSMAVDNARLYQQAREADTRKDEFLAMLAHELRNPLAPIRTSLYMLKINEPPDPQISHLHQIIDNQVSHLVRLVDDLLDVSRITLGRIELRFEPVELRRIIDAAVEIAGPLFREKGHELHVSVPVARIVLHADMVRLVQAVANLLNNAAKYTNKGGQVWLSAAVVEQQAVIHVRDTGIGIAPEMRGRIFDLFEQVNRAMELSRGGLGVGLTLVRTLVQMHGGTVEVHSPGLALGSEFTIRLPVLCVEETRAALEPKVPDPAAGPSSAPLRILVVDDQASVAKGLEMVLNRWGYVVEVCADGMTALEKARTFAPEVVLTDLGLPQMNGYQLAVEMRRVPGLEDAVLFAISGYGQAQDLERSRSAGFATHLVKPIDLAEMQRLLEGIGRPKVEATR